MGIGLKSRSSIVGYVNEGSNCTRQYVNVVETGKGLAFGKKEEGMEVSLRQSHLKDWIDF